MKRLLALLALLLSLTPFAARAAEPAVIELPRFRIEYTPHSAGVAVLLSKQIEDERSLLAKRMGRDYDGKTEVRIGDGPDETDVLAPKGPGLLPPRWAAGVAYPEANVLVFDAQALRRDEARQLVVHELSHIALGRTGRGEWPRWFQEGFAMLMAGEWSVSRYTAMYRATVGEAEIPLNALVAHWPERQAEAEIAYAESLSFVAHVYDKWGDANFRRLIDGVAEGKSFGDAFGQVYGVSIGSEEALWKKSLSTKYTWLPVLTGTGTLWMFITVIFLMAWARTKHRNRERLVAMEIEERAREAALRIAAAERAALLNGTTAPSPAEDALPFDEPDDDGGEEPPGTDEGQGRLLH